jgi:hypothetical protein
MLLSAGASAVAIVIVGIVESPALALALSPLLLLSVGLPIWLLLATSYAFTATELKIRCGPFGWRVPLDEIRNVTATRDPLSSPALSLDRLRIDFGRKGSIMISPSDKEGFLQELSKRARLRQAGD